MVESLKRVDGRDAEIKTSDVEDVPLTVLSLLGDLTGVGERSVNDFAIKAERNELFMRGEQYRDIDRETVAPTDCLSITYSAIATTGSMFKIMIVKV